MWIGKMQLSPELLRYSEMNNVNPPSHLGRRYKARGGFLPEAGNTIVCHIVRQSETQDRLNEAREKYLAMPEAEKLLFTPITSLHMTLFQGVIDSRRQCGYWPSDVSLDTPIDAATDIMASRLAAFPDCNPFQVAVVRARPSGLLVDGLTARDRKAMRTWRDAFASLFGYRHPDHDDYLFHITFAYAIEWLSAEVLPSWQVMLDEVVSDLRRSVPVLELTTPAFCIFEDMNHFHEIRRLNLREPVK